MRPTPSITHARLWLHVDSYRNMFYVRIQYLGPMSHPTIICCRVVTLSLSMYTVTFQSNAIHCALLSIAMQDRCMYIAACPSHAS
jgi:hypothetical protein